MPTYQYHCPSCGNDFEEFQSITEHPLDACPKCGKKPHRVISGGGGLLFKGSGFYQTDYRSKQYQTEAKKDQQSSASSESSTLPKDKASKTDSRKAE